MKNLVVCAVFVALFAWSASADASYYLYWGVNSGSEYAFNYATIKAKTPNGDAWSNYLSLYSNSSKTYTKLYADSDTSKTGTTAGNAFAGVDGYTLAGSQFLVELWTTDASSSSDKLVAWKSVDYETVSKNSSIYTAMNTANPTAYTFANFVPEPTSGLLLLMGCAALALRRKQQAA